MDVHIISFGLSDDLLVDLSLLLYLLSQFAVLQLEFLWWLFDQMHDLACTVPCGFALDESLLVDV